jgi:hypothetical protein
MDSGVYFAGLSTLSDEEMAAVGGAGRETMADRVYRK